MKSQQGARSAVDMLRLAKTSFIFLLLWFQGAVAAGEFNVSLSEFPVISQQSEDKSGGDGLMPELLGELAQRANLTLRLSFLPPRRAQRVFMENEVRFSIGSPNLYKEVDVPDGDIGFIHLYNTDFVIYYYKPNHTAIDFELLSDLSPYKITAHHGSSSLLRYEEAGIKLSFYSDIASALSMLELGRVDLMDGSYLAVQDTLKNKFADRSADFAILSKPSHTVPIGIVYKKSDPVSVALAQRLREAQQRVRQDGTYLKIFQRYWGERVPDYILSK